MCLIALAHRASDDFPFVLAANRDEDYDRPTIAAGYWSDAPQILGGRDALLGGSWLAITRLGRFAAVTNLRGSERAAQNRSRGELVREFVMGSATPLQYGEDVERRIHQYTGFHLLVGEIGGDVVQVSGSAQRLEPGIHALSNAPNGEQWPKVEAALEEMRRQEWRSSTDIVASLLQFLQSGRSGDPRNDPFLIGEQYGTRSSTIIVASREEVLFVEQNYEKGGEEGARSIRAYDRRP
ncbi:MAG TPA: NRDE family protein [Thermoanaerobaculia bacterium]|nr:NRDE family protein [Thermoanaerobaculia bacterium]